ncbi:MAG TPA: acyl-CoA dehydrogenase C-terminal domain-containing protein, partial [Rhizobiaceae bacterium]|nr:acyl-CoA dehydrogenase C-terminal domain-containing protein [Rhizobiaceae bacterium]
QEAGDWLLAALSAGRMDEALAGATPYLRLFGIAAGGAYLAKAGLADGARAPLARFFAENHLAECAALKARVTGGAASLAAARNLLVA